MGLLLKNLLFTVLVPGTVAIYLPLHLVQGHDPADGTWRALSLIFLAAGGAIYCWCLWDFASYGRGTPAPIDAPVKLVVRGLYRYSRNPMYVGVLTVVLGWAVHYRAPGLLLYAAGVGLMFRTFVILYEEPHLQRVFGSSYDEYRARVPRWLPGTRVG